MAASSGTATRRNVMAAGLAAGLGGLATASLAPSEALAVVSGQYNVKDDFGALGDGTTDDGDAIQDAIDAASGAGGGIVFFPAGTYAVDASSALVVADKVHLAGVGRGSVIKCTNEGTTTRIGLFEFANGATSVFSDLAIKGPAAIGVGGRFDATYVNTASGRLRFERCFFNDFTCALRVSSASIWTGALEAIGCELDGYGSSQASTPILVNSQSSGGRGRRLSVFNCVFRNFGKTSGNLDHAIYVATDWDFECVNNEFVDAEGTGYAVHVYDENVSAANASRHQKIVGCRFGATLDTAHGVVSGSQAHLLVDGCTFENPSTWVVFNGGGGDVVNCDFVGQLSGTNGILTSSTPATPVSVKSNRFLSTATKFVVIGHPGDYNVEGNTFDPSSNPSTCCSIEGAATVRVADNSFLGATNTACVRVSGSGASNVAIENNRFREGGGAGVENSNPSSNLRVVGNDFSPAGGSSFSLPALPSAFEVDSNHGSQSPSQGKAIVATEQSRSNTAYGLLPTPDRVQGIVMPTDGLIVVAYQAQFKSSVAAAGRAAIFVGPNQLMGQGAPAPAVQEVSTVGANQYVGLASSAVGLTRGGGAVTSDDATTGQLVGLPTNQLGGACVIFAAAGLYDVSIQFRATSGSVTAKGRKLWIWTLGF